jgi:hypothetical protein
MDLHSNWKERFDELLVWKIAADSYAMIACCPLKIPEVEESYDMPDVDWIDPPSKRRVFEHGYEVKPLKYHKCPEYWKYIGK